MFLLVAGEAPVAWSDEDSCAAGVSARRHIVLYVLGQSLAVIINELRAGDQASLYHPHLGPG